mmetsp:Transcript_16556/g.28972  ORF Transcript_16556/g.28972 Transcript_16556/m.28972 type:complete len:212 (+) Transcript_16556:375-1010(+)|eukprot:CAMPEP_0184693178 /NCGR_PEP_ID=MMETSP0313-20130426/1454_1 /TAXON_ID=2792 /ORGANISM="Porphyridium aerugineum, Strain SAG 1380-2" /LENGTH=211 /DNA_ID=CAMNT_0027151177 /DNA_START=326 /DNA_END=961 /DNA_ORIENTATION=-
MAFISGFSTALSTSVRAKATCARNATTVVMAAKSKSVPFADQPPALDGTLAGDAGFDPLNISSYLNVKWLAEAEIKHGRVCMLACLGFWAQEFGLIFPDAPHLPHLAHDKFAQWNGPLGQVLIWVSFWEAITTPAVIQMVTGESDRKPGQFFFDPLGLAKNPETYKRFAVSEVKNGRLAMIGISGMLTQTVMTNKTPIDQLLHGPYLPVPF